MLGYLLFEVHDLRLGRFDLLGILFYFACDFLSLCFDLLNFILFESYCLGRCLAALLFLQESEPVLEIFHLVPQIHGLVFFGEKGAELLLELCLLLPQFLSLSVAIEIGVDFF